MKLKRSAVIRALEFLQLYIQNQKDKGLDEVDTVTDLAKRASVGRNSMIKALTILKEKGIIAGSERQPYRIINGKHRVFGESVITDEADSSVPPLWQRIAYEIERDLLHGIIGNHTGLPSKQQLQSRYGVSFVTLRKSLLHLERQRVIRRDMKSYRLINTKTLSTKNTIILIAAGFFSSKLAPYMQKETQFLIDMVMKEFGLHIKIFSIYEASLPSELIAALQDREKNYSVLGILFWNRGVSAPTAFRLTTQYLLFQNIPVAIFDNNNTLPRSVFRQPTNPNVVCFRTEPDRISGERVGRYLISKHRKNIVYLNTQPEQSWSQERFAGLSAYCREMGASCKEIILSYEHPGNDTFDYRLYPYMYHEVAHIDMSVKEIKTRRSLVIHHHNFRMFTERVFKFKSIVNEMEQKFNSNNIDAIVCCRDDLSVICTDFLDTKGITIPGQIGVIGFDNTVESAHWQLSSYEFNYSAIFRAMIQHVLGHEWIKRHKQKSGCVVIDGYVVERESL